MDYSKGQTRVTRAGSYPPSFFVVRELSSVSITHGPSPAQSAFTITIVLAPAPQPGALERSETFLPNHCV